MPLRMCACMCAWVLSSSPLAQPGIRPLQERAAAAADTQGIEAAKAGAVALLEKAKQARV